MLAGMDHDREARSILQSCVEPEQETLMPEALECPSLTPPKMRYSQVVKAGPHYYCSGMVALDSSTGQLSGKGPGEETAVILANLMLLMEDLGLSLDDLVQARIFTTRFDRFAEINQAWERVFTAGRVPPARTSVGVADLPLGASVEIDFTFYREQA